MRTGARHRSRQPQRRMPDPLQYKGKRGVSKTARQRWHRCPKCKFWRKPVGRLQHGGNRHDPSREPVTGRWLHARHPGAGVPSPSPGGAALRKPPAGGQWARPGAHCAKVPFVVKCMRCPRAQMVGVLCGHMERRFPIAVLHTFQRLQRQCGLPFD